MANSRFVCKDFNALTFLLIRASSGELLVTLIENMNRDPYKQQKAAGGSENFSAEFLTPKERSQEILKHAYIEIGEETGLWIDPEPSPYHQGSLILVDEEYSEASNHRRVAYMYEMQPNELAWFYESTEDFPPDMDEEIVDTPKLYSLVEGMEAVYDSQLRVYAKMIWLLLEREFGVNPFTPENFSKFGAIVEYSQELPRDKVFLARKKMLDELKAFMESLEAEEEGGQDMVAEAA